MFETFSIGFVTNDHRTHFVCDVWGKVAGSSCFLLDRSGTQESESLELAKKMADLVGVRIGAAVERMIDMATCPECNLPVSHNLSKCMYCGAKMK